ncbi:hypothetical protein COV13_00845 [Candidatus Woesearchaeota archaeon CG10_big_fil_rev_8_21_14_0_10_32_9]|nr:MAG: hypothetical protein COV13_00845 [Candidatus Woesearchaeota archaeon CG10_big_fil_rev_8_21_14_0_10_32_9]
MAVIGILIGFLISLVISAVIIYLAAKMLGEKEGFGTAVFAAFIGAIIFALVSYFIGVGWIAALVGGLTWLIALGSLYKIGWLKAFVIAVIIWIFATIVSLVLPTVIGPL